MRFSVALPDLLWHDVRAAYWTWVKTQPHSAPETLQAFIRRVVGQHTHREVKERRAVCNYSGVGGMYDGKKSSHLVVMEDAEYQLMLAAIERDRATYEPLITVSDFVADALGLAVCATRSVVRDLVEPPARIPVGWRAMLERPECG